MSQSKSDLKQQLKKISVPVFLDLALVMLVGAIDIAMLSRYSDNAVAAVGMDNQLIALIFLIYQFISMGATILCAQYIGAGLRRRLVQVVGLALLLNLVIGMAVSFWLFADAEGVLRFMGLRDELMADGLVYLRITGGLSFCQAISLAFSASLRSADKAAWPMVVTLIANVLNVVGNYALIFGHWGCPAMGVEGAAWSTALSRVVAMVLLAVIHTRVHIQKYPKEWFRPFPWRELRNLFHIGIPAMSEEVSYSLSQIVVTYFINQISNEALAARTYCVNIVMFGYLFCLSITQGGDILVGHLVGQNRYRAAYTLGNYFMRQSMRVTLTCSAIIAALGYPILTALTDNAEIVQMGVWVLVIDWFLEIGRVRNVFACGTLRAAGDAIYPVIIGIIFQWTVAVGISYLLGIPLGFGLLGMWVGFALDENIRGVVLMRRWHSMRWTGKNFAV